MKTMKVASLIATLMAVPLTGACAQEATPAEPKVLRDGDGAKFMRVENMHQTRFIEIFLANPEATSGNMVAACYNTMFTSKGIPYVEGHRPAGSG